MTDRNTGSSFDALLEEEGLLEAVDAVAAKRVIAWQLQQQMAARHSAKKARADCVNSSEDAPDMHGTASEHG